MFHLDHLFASWMCLQYFERFPNYILDSALLLQMYVYVYSNFE